MPHHNVQQQARIGWVKLPTNYSVLVVLATVLLIVIYPFNLKMQVSISESYP